MTSHHQAAGTDLIGLDSPEPEREYSVALPHGRERASGGGRRRDEESPSDQRRAESEQHDEEGCERVPRDLLAR
jgi:hypothetical protein